MRNCSDLGLQLGEASMDSGLARTIYPESIMKQNQYRGYAVVDKLVSYFFMHCGTAQADYVGYTRRILLRMTYRWCFEACCTTKESSFW